MAYNRVYCVSFHLQNNPSIGWRDSSFQSSAKLTVPGPFQPAEIPERNGHRKGRVSSKHR